MSLIKIDIVSADKTIFNGHCEIVTISTTEGEIGVKKGHTPLLASIKPGHIMIKDDTGSRQEIFISGGFVEVQPNKVTILADTVERAEDIDLLEAEKSMQDAKDKMTTAKGIDFEKAQRELAEASARINLVNQIKKN